MLAACSIQSDPIVECMDVSAEICDHAADAAKEVAGETWWATDSVLVHYGGCTLHMRCSPEAAMTHQAVTVELARGGPEEPFVRIDLTADWDAICLVLIHTSSGAHTEPCHQ
jgi:hypothetical protein